MRGHRYIGLAVVCAMVAACGSSPGSPSAAPSSATPRASAQASSGGPSGSPPAASGEAPSSQPAAVAPWTFATGDIRALQFGNDGTAYLFAWNGDQPSQLVALDRAGAVKSGWPVGVGKDGVGGGPVEAPDNDVLVLTFSYDDAGVISYQLRRFYPDGTPADGWPYLFDKGTDCAGPVLDATGNAVVVCGSDAGSRMVAIDTNGDAAWDTDLPTVRNATGLQRGDDGSLYVVSASGDGLMAVGPTGLIPDGWPVEAGDGADIMATPTGLLAWWHVGADQDICHGGGTTVYTILGPDGAPRSDWPQAIVGYGSEPAVGQDGTVYVVDAAKHALAYGPDGRILAGWPATVSGVTGSCFGPPTPSVASDGTVFVATGGAAPDGSLSAIGPDGRSLDGWPLAPQTEFAYSCRGCAPGPPEPNPAITAGMATYVAMYRGDAPAGTDVVGLDRAGAALPGWPAHLTAGEARLQLAPDGRLFAILVNPENSTAATLAYLGPAS